MTARLPGLVLVFRWLFLVASGVVLADRIEATTVIPPDFDQLVNESDYVIRSVVKSVTTEYRPSASGRKIVTKVELEVHEVVAGTPPAQVVLELLGGRVGDEEMVVEGSPRFQVGDEDILFVSGNGRTVCPLFAMMHGRYPIMKEAATGREYMARSNRVPLMSTSDVALPMGQGATGTLQLRLASPAQALPPGEFVQQVKAAINPSYVRKQL